ncbi:ABC transporter permease [Cellulomonas denverensis]|uniref:ABC transporter permease n=1 Tax=Cellulomonas denverensis TaxID=264297 RepID=A0A7X6KYH9_9CELL|nr:ABC transporter permease [Cellulomonas denverensis]NKY24493.1 ABC transporter permease [Cellulomonas denverensis]GIG27400.1 hypothetical protein Cde04nite_36440 [Cellulomonas denverensis]
MRSARAIVIKQGLDMLKNWTVLIQFVIYPVIAFIFTLLVARKNDEIPDTMFVTMFAVIFASMTIIIAITSVIAEDRENGSIRFLAMAGVKPHEYLVGTGGVVVAVSAVVVAVFAVMGGFTGAGTITFFGCVMLGVIASTLLGAILGMLARNQQSAVALGMPVAMVLGFGPMLATFDSTVERVFTVFYTQQVSLVANDVSAGLLRPLLVIAANLAVLAALFAVVYRRRGLR